MPTLLLFIVMFASSSFITGRLPCQPPSCVVSFGNHRSFPLSFVLIRLSVHARLSFCIHLRPSASSSIICRWPLHLSTSASLFIHHRPLRLQSSAVVPSTITNHCSVHLPPSVCPYIHLRSLASSIISSLSATFSRRPFGHHQSLLPPFTFVRRGGGCHSCRYTAIHRE